MSERHFVYIIGCELGDDDTRPVKIGVSNNPSKRLSQLQTASPFTLCLRAAYEAPTREIAMALERAFHDVCADRNAHGEWFDISGDEAVKLMRSNFSACMRRIGFNAEEILAGLKAAGF